MFVGLPLVVLLGCQQSPQAQLKARKLSFTASEFVHQVRASNPSNVGLFLDAGIDPDSTGDNGVPALSWAVQNEDRETVSLLLAHGVDTGVAVANAGMTALMLAAANGSSRILQALCDSGASLDQIDDYGNSALHHAAQSKHPEAATILLDAGASADLLTRRGISPLMIAAYSGDRELAGILLRQPIKLNRRDTDQGMTALAMAASRGHAGLAAQLLAAGADPTLADNRGHTALSLAAGGGYIETVKQFIAAGVHPDTAGRMHQTPLSWAALGKHLEISRLLLEAGADPNLPDKDGLLPLQIAESAQQSRLATLLRSHGATNDLSSALEMQAMLSRRPAHLSDSWVVEDPFTDATPYYPGYSFLSTTFSPPASKRALVRSPLTEQSQLMIVSGPAAAWSRHYAKRREQLIAGLQVNPLAPVFIGSATLKLELVRQPPGLLAGDDVTHLIGKADCGSRVILIDAGGSTAVFDVDGMVSLVSDLKFKHAPICDLRKRNPPVPK